MLKIRLLWLLSIWIIKSISSISQFYYNVSNRRGIPVNVFRKYENLTYKLAKKSLDKEFFLTCLDLEMCPSFLKFKSPELKAYENTKPIYQQVVRQQVDVVQREIDITKKKWSAIRAMLFDQLTFLERRCLTQLVQAQLSKRLKADKDRINTKLEKTWSQYKYHSPNCLINLSSKKLDIYEKNVLYLGLNHHILPKKVNDVDIKAQIEKMMKSVVSHLGNPLDYDTKEEVKCEVQSFIKHARRVCSKKTNQTFHKSIQKLSNDDNIVICKFDKGNGVVILDKNDYIKKCNDILSDTSKFEKLDCTQITDIILKKRSSLQNYVYRYLHYDKNDEIDKKTYDVLYDVGSSPGKFYGLVKVHKDGYPIRPVVSMINTPEYGLAKWLDTFIQPNIPNHYMLNSTEHFVNVLKDFPFYSGDKLVSFDVKSLYTNVPLKETVDIVTKYVYSKESVCIPPIPKTIFRKLLLKVTEGNFMFNGECYKQVDGLAMGGPLGPSLANFFLAHLEKTKMFNNCPYTMHPKLYLRYIDDVFAVFDSKQQHDDFFSYINCLHSNLEFTVELATHSLPFLDVDVAISNDNVNLCIYRKKTNTNVLLNFGAITPFKWKESLIFGALHRALKICSSTSLFNQEVNKLCHIFHKNGYPVNFFNRVYDKFMKRINNSVDVSNESDDVNDERTFLLILPFIDNASKVFEKKLKNILLKKLGVKIRTVYKSCKLSSFFSLKDKTPLTLVSNAVYKFSCLRDANITYLGETTRPLSLRVNEHLSLNKKTKTAVGKHIVNCCTCKQHAFTLHDFHIVKRCQTPGETRVQEALLIRKFSPAINKQLYLAGASFVLSVY